MDSNFSVLLVRTLIVWNLAVYIILLNVVIGKMKLNNFFN